MHRHGLGGNDTNRMRFENDQFYMKTEEEMREALQDFPEACDNTVSSPKSATSCSSEMKFCRASPCLRAIPRKAVPQEFEEGLEKRYGDGPMSCPTRGEKSDRV